MTDDTPDTRDDTAGQTDPVSASAAADETPESEHDDQDEDRDDTDDPNPNHEAARYRVERNEARAERDALREQFTVAREQVTALRQSIVDGIATAAGLRDPGLLGREGPDLDTLLSDDGTVDEDKVRTVTAELMRKHNIAPKRVLEPNFQQGAHGQPSAQRVSQAWTGAFAPRRG